MEFELTDTSLQINDLDREQLKDLPIRFLGNLSSETNYHIALSLIDICFAFAYDLRTNTGEHTVESGWTIAKQRTRSMLIDHERGDQAALQCRSDRLPAMGAIGDGHDFGSGTKIVK